MEELKKFIVKAKINSYANDQVEENKLDDGSKELIFEKGNLKYRDRYFGFNPFIGQEVVWKNDKAIWSMIYVGKINSKDISEGEVYKFLRKAMRNISIERPFRGPEKYKEKKLEYRDKSEGDINYFQGVETIFYDGKKVYELFYHGGLINE